MLMPIWTGTSFIRGNDQIKLTLAVPECYKIDIDQCYAKTA